MSDVIKTDRALYLEAKNAAIDIFAEFESENPNHFDPEHWRDEMYERAHEFADMSQHVIYTFRALQICANCDTSEGEAFIEEIGIGENPTFYSIATLIAYGQLRSMIESELETLIDEWSDPKTIYTVAANFLPALINGDYSALSTREEKELREFVERETNGVENYHWSSEDGDSHFATCEVLGVKADCVDVTLVNMDIVQSNKELLTPEYDEPETPERRAHRILSELRVALEDVKPDSIVIDAMSTIRAAINEVEKDKESK